MARTKARENKVKWVGPIASFSVDFISKTNHNVNVNDIDDVKSVESIGVASASESIEILDDHQFVNYRQVINSESGLKQLLYGRISLWLESPQTVNYLSKKHGVPANQTTSLFTFYTGELYLAFSKDTDDKTVDQWRQALATLKANGQFKEIMKQYEPAPHVKEK
jgi:polar amino acid transport system substrate-binding protein